MQSTVNIVLMFAFCLLMAACSDSDSSPQITAQTVREDPLLRMPGTQPGEVTLESSTTCYECHGSGKGLSLIHI